MVLRDGWRDLGARGNTWDSKIGGRLGASKQTKKSEEKPRCNFIKKERKKSQYQLRTLIKLMHLYRCVKTKEKAYEHMN